MRTRIPVLAALTAVAAMSFAPLAQAGTDQFLVRAALSKNGAYSQEIQGAEVAVGETENFFFRIRSKVNGTRRVVFEDAATDSPPALKTRWFTDDGENITDDVKGDGKRFRLPGGAAEFIEMRVTATDEATDCVVGRGSDRDSDFAASATIGLNTNCF